MAERSDPAALARGAPRARVVREASGRATELWAAASRVAAAAPEPRARARRRAVAPGPSPYRPRFGFVLGALIGVALRRDRHRRRARGERRIDRRRAARLVGLEAVGRRRRRRRPSRSPSTSARSTGSATRTSSSPSHAKPLELADRPLNVALRTAAVGGDIELLDGNGVMYTLNGLGPQRLDPRRQALGGAPPAAAARGARARALHVPLRSRRRHGRRAPAAPRRRRRARRRRTRRSRRSRRCSTGPATCSGELGVPLATTIPNATPQPGADQARRARVAADRRADPLEPVHGDVPAGPGREPLPRARPPADGLSVLGAGLCASCRHQKLIRNGRAARSSRCACARGPTPRYPKYPRLPVLACRGHEPLRPGDDPAGPGPRGAGSPAA